MKKQLITTISVLFCSFSLMAQSLSLSSLAKASGNSSGNAETNLMMNAAVDSVANRVQLAMSNSDYLVTAGDIYGLGFIVGSSPMEYKIIVDSSYKVRVANLAVIDAAGKSYLTLKRQVEDIVSKNYPMSGVQFTLVTPAVFNVIVKGEVVQTSEQSAWALSRLSSVIADNLTNYSSIRDITVTSSAGVSKHYDLYAALRDGDVAQNPYLRPGDVITIRKVHKKVTINGSVRRPGTYELLEGEMLKELIDDYAGGFTEYADTSRISVTRIVNGSEKTGSVFYIENPLKLSNYALNSFDSIYVNTLSQSRPVMFMEGAVMKQKNPLDDAITEVEGATRVTVSFDYDENYAYFIRARKSYFESAIADLQNAFIVRGEEIIPFDISKALYDSSFTTDLMVEPNDLLRVPMKQFFVSVSGSVNLPGRYPYIPNKTYDYYIGLAGGFNKTMNSHKAVEIIDADGNKLNKNSEITPETTITAETNSFLFYFNQYAPVVTTVLTIISTTLSIMAVTGVFSN